MRQVVTAVQVEPSLFEVPQHYRVPASWVEISAHAVAHNIAQYRTLVPATHAFAVVLKSNAYGHGLSEIAHMCDRHAGVDWICTVNLSEALFLRSQGITKPILVLSYIDAPLSEAVRHTIDVVVYDEQTVAALSSAAQQLGQTAAVHVKVDTGLSRLGVSADTAVSFVQWASSMPSITIRGLFTHLANSERSGRSFTGRQISSLQKIRRALEQQQVKIPWYHYSCTAALTAVEKQVGTFARMGLGIYGLWPSTTNKEWSAIQYPHMKLMPVMTWKTSVIQVKKVPQGTSIGYGCSYTTARESMLAVVPIGYWEGYDRRLSNRGCMMIRGAYAPVVGKVSMNLTVLDVTDIPHVCVGDEVMILGGCDKISADALAEQMGTINWEVVTRINPLIRRIVI